MIKHNNTKVANDIEKENLKKDIIINSIENFIEKKNRYIQIVLLIFAVIAGVAYGLVSEETQDIVRYTLVMNIFMEIYVLQTKDSIMQKKMNWLAVDVNAQNGGLRFEEDINVDDFFDNANRDFFISGIAPSRFVQKYQPKIEEMLKNNKKITVYVLISSLETVSENCAEYYGTKNDSIHQYDLLSKLSVVINSIENSLILKEAFKEKRLLLATSDIVFTTSFVAYDLFNSEKYHSKIKITFYQQGEHQAGKLPSVILDSGKNIRDMYPYFQNIIKNQWETVRVIKEEQELTALSNELLCLLQKCKNH